MYELVLWKELILPRLAKISPCCGRKFVEKYYAQ